jgi:hypothetical protein
MTTFKIYSNGNASDTVEGITELAKTLGVSSQIAKKAFYRSVCTINNCKVINYGK